jgi:hypothetical protein
MDVSREAAAGGTAERAAVAGGIVLLTLASAQFLMTLDSSVMNVSMWWARCCPRWAWA